MTRTTTRLAATVPRIRRVSLLLEFDAKKSLSLANPRVDHGRIFSDASERPWNRLLTAEKT
jgi:hypothetical protein